MTFLTRLLAGATAAVGAVGGALLGMLDIKRQVRLIVVLMMLWWTLLRWDVRGIARDTRPFDGNRLFNRWSLMAYGSFSAFLLRERILLSCVSSSERSLVVHSPGEDRAVLGELVRAFPDRSLPM